MGIPRVPVSFIARIATLQSPVPLFSIVSPQQVLVGVEQDAVLVVAPGDPEGQRGGLEPGPDVEGAGGGQVLLPQQEPDVTPLLDSNPFVDLVEDYLMINHFKTIF